MQNNRKNWILVVIVVITKVIVSLGISLDNHQSLNQSPKAQSTPPQWKQAREEFNKQFPTADYDAPEDTNPQTRDIRKSKNKRYDKQNIVSPRLPEDGEERVLVVDSIPIPGLPASESEIIIIGKVLNAQAFVSNNKRGVYSEFAIGIDKILKNNSANLAQGNMVTVDREGIQQWQKTPL